jgi:hypothetical protein
MRNVVGGTYCVRMPETKCPDGHPATAIMSDGEGPAILHCNACGPWMRNDAGDLERKLRKRDLLKARAVELVERGIARLRGKPSV